MMNPHEFEAVIFDMDGVITQTATLHAYAWKRRSINIWNGASGEEARVGLLSISKLIVGSMWMASRATRACAASWLPAESTCLRETRPIALGTSCFILRQGQSSTTR